MIGEQCQGIQHEILECINSCDLALRKQLMSHITLIGGTSLLNGFAKRLVNELVLSDYNRYNYPLSPLSTSKHSSSKDSSLQPQPGISGLTAIRETQTQSLSPMHSKQRRMSKKTGIRIYAPRNRKYSAWIGGSVLCSMDSFNEEMWITQKLWREHGNAILYRQLQ